MRWSTDEPATTAIDFGLSPSYGKRLEDGRLVQEHEVRLTDLQPGAVRDHIRIVK